jgi:hypothetical protein
MSRPQEVRPGAKVPRSGIYQDNLSQRRATLVKGEPAPPTPHKAGRWQQVVDTASAPTYRGPAVDPAQWGGPRGRPHTVGVVGSHAARATPAAAARPRERTGWRRGAGLLRWRRIRPLPGQRFQPTPARRHATECPETLRRATPEARRLRCQMSLVAGGRRRPGVVPTIVPLLHNVWLN